MIQQLCRFWEGPTLGELPEVQVRTIEGVPGYCCTCTFSEHHDRPRLDHVVMAKHIASLRFKSGAPIFGHVNVATETHYHIDVPNE